MYSEDIKEEEFIKRISKMGPNLVIKVPKDRHRDFERGDLVKVILIKKNHKIEGL